MLDNEMEMNMIKPTQGSRVRTQTETGQVPEEALPFLSWDQRGEMSCRQVAILLTVRANPGFSTGAISQLLGVPKPAITRASRKLEQMGLMRRVTNSFDRRMVELWPASKKGRRYV